MLVVPRSLLQVLLPGSALAVVAAVATSCSSSEIAGPVPVASVSIAITSPSLVVGSTTMATATPMDGDGHTLSGRTITWSSSNTDVATVSASGELTGLAPGSTDITATSEGKAASATLTVIPPPVATVSLTLASATLAVGNTATAIPVLKDENGNVLTDRAITWSSSDPSIAAVNEQGMVSAIAVGAATITATSEGKTGTAALTVVPPSISTVTVAIADAQLRIGSSTQATAIARDDKGNVLTGRPVGWSSDKPDVATVSSLGVVTGVAVGSATITATSEGKTGSASVSVALTPIATITVTLADANLQVGSTTQARAVAKDENGIDLTGRPVVWTSDNADVATVSSLGLVTGVKVGTAHIIATSEGKSGSASVSVALTPVSTITVTVANSQLQIGATTQATAVAKDENGNVLTGRSLAWTTDNPEVATVNSQGLVTAVGSGNVSITATSEGKSGSASVAVTAPLVPVIQRSLTLGANHGCAISVEEAMYCWGSNHNGQVGNRAGMSFPQPAPVTGGYKFEAISAASNTTYALLGTGEIYCWGGVPCDPNAGNTIDEYNGPAVVEPKRMATTRTILALGSGSAPGGGYEPMCAIGTGNVAYCWGKNTHGELGLGSASSDTVLVPDRPVVGGHAFSDIASGENHVCALTTTGTPYCWGGGSKGQLGDGSGADSGEPRALAGNYVFKMIGAGTSFACGLSTAGAAYCWGDNGASQLGTSTGTCLGNTSPCSALPVAVDGGHVFTFIAVRSADACGVTVDGDIYCWGYDYGATPTRFRSALANEPGGVRFSTVDIGAVHICGVTTTGDAWCRGSNNTGQLGNGGFGDPVLEPTLVVGGIKFRTP